MKILVLIFSIISLSCGNQFVGTMQEIDNTNSNEPLSDSVWIDYVIGKPYLAHFEAMEKVAKAWGFNYQAHFAGCEMSEEVEKEADKIEKANKAYFAKLEAKFGKDWHQRFNIEVKKEMPIYTEIENPVWKYTILGKPSMQYIEAKKEVAKAWGINLEPVFLGCVIDKPGVKEADNKATKESKAYLKAIAAHYGEDWQTYFNKEVQAKAASMSGQ